MNIIGKNKQWKPRRNWWKPLDINEHHGEITEHHGKINEKTKRQQKIDEHFAEIDENKGNINEHEWTHGSPWRNWWTPWRNHWKPWKINENHGVDECLWKSTKTTEKWTISFSRLEKNTAPFCKCIISREFQTIQTAWLGLTLHPRK